MLVSMGYRQVRQGDPVDTYSRSPSEDTRRKAAKFGAMGHTVAGAKPD